uniref:Large ribosomal subunit protein uL15/eL18 domain-containing protein n=1 Tax=Balaenoptera musculus TaxID=9771 RepID=A0A8C0CN73_BALMU
MGSIPGQGLRSCKLRGKDSYLRLLVKLYRFLARPTNSFSQVVLKRLFVSCTNWWPLSLSQMIRKMKLPGGEGKTAVVIGTKTDDVCALPPEPHPQVQEHQRPTGQLPLQKPTPDPALLLKRFWMLKKKRRRRRMRPKIG